MQEIGKEIQLYYLREHQVALIMERAIILDSTFKRCLPWNKKRLEVINNELAKLEQETLRLMEGKTEK